jgi:transcriptional regulator with XRE-family HTH domain
MDKKFKLVPVAGKTMSRRHRLIRMFRALSGLSQEEFSDATGIDSSLLAHYEQGRHEPRAENLERAAGGAGLTVEEGEELLDFGVALSRGRRRAGRGAEDLGRALSEVTIRAYQLLLRVPLPAPPPRPEDRQLAAEQWQRLQGLAPEEQLSVVWAAREFHNWALAEICCEESVAQASRDIEGAEHLARLAVAIAERVEGPEGWPGALRGWVEGHPANVLRVQGELKAARTGLEEAQRLWRSGSDPAGLLDPGRLLDLEASLCRAERRFEAALDLLEQARGVSRCPVHTLIAKGFTLEVMGRYEEAVAALREAEPLLDREAAPRLWYQQRFNLAVLATHLGGHREAAGLIQQVREVAEALGDAIFLLRVTWLEGRVAAGLGLRQAALALLAEARRGFAERDMGYDVALCLLEEAVLLLEEGRTAEVKALAPELAKVFRSQGIHREAAAALQLFHRAAEREEATADLARRLLAWLFRARHDEGLRFTA